VQVTHDGSQVVQAVSVLAVQTALSNDPEVQVAQPSHVVLPISSWNVPAVQAGHVVAPVLGFAVPSGQS
jgi:acyl-CoA reductase-like NAD-dependent aldehyde dehydrogenase